MQFIAHRIFSTEINRLKHLSLMTPFSFVQTRASLVRLVRTPGFDRDAEITVDDTSGESLKITSMLQRLKGQAPRYVRELLFTRAISALEVFLIDTVREIGRISPDKFHSEEQISFPRNQLFSFPSLEAVLVSIIDNDCRQLSSGGFADLTKYYRNKLQVDFTSFTTSITEIEEYHERRNLLVHKLGQTDEHYRHKYNSLLKKVSVDNVYLSRVLSNLDEFGKQLNSAVIAEVFGLQIPTEVAAYRCLCVLEMRGEEIPQILRPTFELIQEQERISIASLTLARVIREKRMTFVLEGNEDLIMRYLDVIRLAHRAGDFQVKYINPKRLQRVFER